MMEEQVAASRGSGSWPTEALSCSLGVGALMIVGAMSIYWMTTRHDVKSRQKQQRKGAQPSIPVSVNYHFTRQCNYQCGFCFHTAKTSFVLPIDEAKRGLQMLAEKGKPTGKL